MNLLPLSHMFGQSMATNIPPMVRGTVIFTRSLNPHDVIDLIRSRRVSVLVCVPKILDVLREHVVAAHAGGRRGAPGRSLHPGPVVAVSARSPRPGPQILGICRRGGAPRPRPRGVLAAHGICRHPGLRPDRDGPNRDPQPPLQDQQGVGRHPIAGVELRIAEDGEILVRGENVTSGYYGDAEGALAADGWLHTGDIGERDAQGRVFIKGRKKEMIVTPDGLNVFPEDVERVVDAQPGVRESAIVGVTEGAQERVHAVVVLEDGADLDAVIRGANAALQDHQRVRTASAWTTGPLPRTEGTRKLRRAAIREWAATGARPATAAAGSSVESLLERFTHGRPVSEGTTIDELGLSSLERVELMVALEDTFQVRFDESRFAQAASIAQLKQLVAATPESDTVEQPVDFPSWNRRRPVWLLRRLSQAIWILPLARVFAHARIEGLEHVRNLHGPVVFASNHQSHFDVPVILAALPGRVRSRVAPAMAKEFFKAHFFPEGQPWQARLSNSLNYYLAAFFFNAFPLPQREAGARQTLKYIGELTGGGWSVLIFPEGVRSKTGDIKPFRGGIGMIGARLDVPVVPVRIDDVDRILPTGSSFARPDPCAWRLARR